MDLAKVGINTVQKTSPLFPVMIEPDALCTWLYGVGTYACHANMFVYMLRASSFFMQCSCTSPSHKTNTVRACLSKGISFYAGSICVAAPKEYTLGARVGLLDVVNWRERVRA